MSTGAIAIAVPNSAATFNLNEQTHMDFYGDGKETVDSMAWPGLFGLSPSSLGEILPENCMCSFLPSLVWLEQHPGPLV